jgi:hypothetical protein
VTRDLNSSISWSPTSAPFSFARDFFREPRWSIAAAAMTPRSFDTAFMPASLPGVIFTIESSGKYGAAAPGGQSTAEINPYCT